MRTDTSPSLYRVVFIFSGPFGNKRCKSFAEVSAVTTKPSNILLVVRSSVILLAIDAHGGILCAVVVHAFAFMVIANPVANVCRHNVRQFFTLLLPELMFLIFAGSGAVFHSVSLVLTRGCVGYPDTHRRRLDYCFLFCGLGFPPPPIVTVGASTCGGVAASSSTTKPWWNRRRCRSSSVSMSMMPPSTP